MIPQSATSITDYKHCPMLYNFRHVLRIRPIEKADVLRQGTNWHRCLEILTSTPGDVCCEDADCPICEGSGIIPEDLREAMIRHMNQVYKTCPPSISLTDWQVERTILLYSAIGWHWHWQNDKVETIATEVPFKRDLSSIYTRRGKIDRVIRRNGALLLGEYKSTSKPIDSGSLYWDRLRLDSQLTLYLIEARHAQLSGKLERYGISASDPPISGMLYDAWHKPQIKPKKLSMSDTKKFLESCEYFGEKYEVTITDIVEGGVPDQIIVGTTRVEVVPGAEPKITKKNPEPTRPFAIRETPEMFGARLLADIREYPDKHFARHEIPRTDDELLKLDREYRNIARLAEFATIRDLWFRNEDHCDATYRCPYYSICYYDVDVTNGNIPEGFHCLNDKGKDAVK